MSDTYQSSRLTKGNFLFPDQLTIADDGVHFMKRKLFGSDEETINYKQIASVKAKNGIIWATLAVETSGGSQPVIINGLGKSSASEIKEAIRRYQNS